MVADFANSAIVWTVAAKLSAFLTNVCAIMFETPQLGWKGWHRIVLVNIALNVKLSMHFITRIIHQAARST